MEKQNHMRTLSDMTAGSNDNSLGYTTLSSSPMANTNVPTSPTILTHSSSIRSIPFMSSIAGSIAPYGTTHSLGRQTSTGPPPSSQEDVIAPYTLPPVSNNPDRKQGSGGYPVYDTPSTPPPNALRVENMQPVTPARRARVNPPTYAESSVDASGSSHGHRANQLSTDTDYSSPSSPINRNLSTSSHSTANVAVVNSSPPSAMRPVHGRQVSTSRGEKIERPSAPTTEASFSARDIA